MSTLGSKIEALAERPIDLDPELGGLVHLLARWHSAHQSFTPAQEATAYDLLVRHGVDLSDIDRPYDDETVEPVVTAAEKVAREFKRVSSVEFRVIDGTIIRAKTPFALKDLCKAVPGRAWNGDLKVWEWEAGPVAATSLRDAFARYDPVWDDEFEALLHRLSKAAEHKSAVDLPDVPHLRTTPWLHQKQAYWFVESLKGAALVMEMGTGKTLVAIARAFDVGGQILVVCPNKVLGVWPREFRRHGAADVHIENGVRPKRGGGHKNLPIRDRIEAFKALRGCDCGRLHVTLVNYEATINSAMSAYLSQNDWDLLVMDESHRVKSAQGAQSKLMTKVSARSRFRLGLTGTPMPHDPLDVFAQYRAIDASMFGRSYVAFRNKYAIMGGFEGKEVLGMNPATIDELHDRFYSIAFRVRADEVLDLPEVTDQVLTTTLDGAQAKAYRDMEANLYAEFGITADDMAADAARGETIAPNALTQLLRLRQITGGSLKDDEGGATHVLGDAKGRLLADWMSDFAVDEPLVVFGEFVHDLSVIRAIAEKQGRVYGEVSGRRNDLTVDSEFPEGIDVMGVQIAAGGVGVDFTRAAFACYYSTGYNGGNYQQSRARLHRPGQKRPVRFYHLIAEATVDETVQTVLANREAEVAGVLDRA